MRRHTLTPTITTIAHMPGLITFTHNLIIHKDGGHR